MSDIIPDPNILAAGRIQAERAGLKCCPNCGEPLPCLFAGEGIWDYIAECPACGFKVAGSNYKQTIRKWNDDLNGKRQKTLQDRDDHNVDII